MDTRAIELHDEALQLMPEGASHDESSCSICVEKATLAEGGDSDDEHSASHEDEPQEGTMSTNTDTLSNETHEALLRTKVADATAELTRDNESLTEQVEALTSERDEAAGKVSTLEGEVARLNNELDTAQVELATANDKVTELESDIAKRDDDAQVREVAQERAKQVRNLKLFPDEAIDEKAERWARLSDEDWADRLDEWKGIQTTNGGEEAGKGKTPTSTETASAITGSSEGQEEAAEQPSARRRVLGLAN